MSTLIAIENALSVIKKRHDLLGADVAEATLQALETQYAVLQETAVSPENPPQRKQVTVLFAQINGLTAFADATPVDKVMYLIKQFWQRLDTAILQQDGYIDKHMGSSVMGVFGVPYAHEDDAERAIRAALAVRAEFHKFIAEMSVQIKATAMNSSAKEHQSAQHLGVALERLQIQIGINSGLVLVEEIGREAEYTVIGDSVNLASRLQQIASPNTILIAQNTYQLISDVFEIEQLGPISTRGKEELTQGYLINGLKARLLESDPRNLDDESVDFVGREEDCAHLAEKWKAVIAIRQNQLQLLVGDAGIGKSRLVAEFFAAEEKAGTIFQRFDGRAEPRLRQTPFALLRYLFSAAFNIHGNDSVVIAREKVLRGMLALLPPKFALPPAWFNAVLQITGLERDPFDDIISESVMTQHAGENLIRTTVDFWSAAAANANALLLVLEDLHWADDYSQRWVLELVDQSRNSPLMIIGLSRPDFFETYPYWEITTKNLLGNHFHKLMLPPLSPQASRQLVLNILQKLWTVPADLYQLILERADGNPYYIEELIKVLVEDGVIVPDGRDWRLDQSAAADLRVPVTLTGVIQARLDNLSFSERVTLQRAAVLGREFWQDALFEINHATQRPLPEAQILTALNNLLRRDMLQLSARLDLAGGQAYAFKYTLLHQVAYESVLLRERPFYHQQAAEWLRTHAGARLPEYAALIGEHLEQGQDFWRAAQTFELAARHAVELSDLDGAIDFNQKALLLAGDPLHRLDWRLGVYRPLIELLFVRARLQEALNSAREMEATAYKVGDMAAQVWVIGQIIVLHREQSEFAMMLEKAREAEQIARLLGSEFDVIDALLRQAEALMILKKSPQALLLVERTLGNARNLNAPQEVCRCLYFIGKLLLEDGQIEQANNCLAQLNTEVERLRQASVEPYVLAGCQVTLWHLCSELAEPQHAVFALKSARQIYLQLEYRADFAMACDGLGQMALADGDLETAVSFFQEAVETAESIGHTYDGLIYRLNLAAVNLVNDDRPAALAALEPVRTISQNPEKINTWRYQASLNETLNNALPNAAQ